MLVDPLEFNKSLNNGNNTASQTGNIQNAAIYDVYSSLNAFFFGENKDILSEENFQKALNGELETDDILALNIIEAASQDDDKTTISKEEFDLLIEKLEENKSDGKNLIEDYTIEDIQNGYSALSQYSEYIDSVIPKYYPNKSYEEISDSDIQKALLSESFTNSTSNTVELINSYFDSEGLIDKGYNFLKELTNLGLSSEDIKMYMANEQFKNSVLETALINGSIKIIDNPENLSDEELLNQGELSKEKIKQIANEKIANSESIDEIVSYCTNYLKMPEENIIKVFEEYLNNNFPTMTELFIEKREDEKYYVLNEYINPDEAREINEYISFENGNDDLSKYLTDEISFKEEYSFEDMYSFLTGVEYNQEKIDEVAELTPLYKEITTNYSVAENLENIFENCTSPTQIVKYYTEALELNKEEAIRYFNQYYKTNIEKLNVSKGYENQYGKCLSFELSEDGKTLKEVYLMNEDQYYTLAMNGLINSKNYNEETGEYVIETDIEALDYAIENNSEFTNESMFKNINKEINSQNIISNQIIEAYNDSDIAKTYGKFEEVIENYKNLIDEAYGKNILNDKFQIYQNDMDTYSSKIANAIATTGFVLCFLPGGQMFGLLALAGSYSDNAIDLVNLATNNKSSEIGAWSAQLLKEATATAIGFGVGAFANKAGDFLCSNLTRRFGNYAAAKVIGTSAEAMTDFTLGLFSDTLYDFMLTGEFNWRGNLTGNLLGSLIDIKGGIGAYRAYKANNGVFDYKFKDGSSLHIDSDGTGYITTKDGTKEIDIGKSNFEIPIDDLGLRKKISELDYSHTEQVKNLVYSGFNPLYAYQIGRLSDIQVENALKLIEEGIPLSKAADAAVLFETKSNKVMNLLDDPDVNNFYITDLLMLQDDKYEIALRAIKEGVSAPSTISGIMKETLTKENFDEEVAKLLASGKMKREITPTIEKELLTMAQILSQEYSENLYAPQNAFLEVLFGEDTKEMKLGSGYFDTTDRAKGLNSTLCKLISKYEDGKIEVDLSGNNATINIAREALTDAYGTRAQLTNLSENDVILALNAHGFSGENALADFQSSLAKMSQQGEPISEEYLAVLNALKEKHNEPAFEALVYAIENKKISIDKLNNYGNELSCYFTTNQITILSNAYYDTYGKYPKLNTKDADTIYQSQKEKVDPSALTDEIDGTYNSDIEYQRAKLEALKEALNSKDAIKASGYTTAQLVYSLLLNGKYFGELQIRGVEVNNFGDVEHIPYDIRQGKITLKDIEYSDIYSAIKGMSEESFNSYNEYLTQVYDYLRLKELGINIGEMPKIDFELKYESGDLLDSNIVQKLTYEGLLQYGHK